MNRRWTIVKKAGIILMALGGLLLFASAMIGPAIEPPINTKPAASVALGLIVFGLIIVLYFRREARRAARPTEATARIPLRTESRPEPVAPKSMR